MPTIYLGLDRWPQIFLERSDQYFLVKSCNGVKLFEHNLQIFQVSSQIHYVFLLVLCVSFNLASETIYKGS